MDRGVFKDERGHAYDGRVVDGTSRWMELNQRYLSAAIGVVRAHIEHAAATAGTTRSTIVAAERALADATKAAAALDDPPALETVATVFGLSGFERSVLVLCAGVELEADLVRLCGAGPTFGMALGALPDAHWGAAAPGAPLRRWRLVEVGAGTTLAASTLRISERCLFELIGTPQLDRDLEAVLEPVDGTCPLTERQQASVARLVAAWSAPRDGPRLPPITVHGGTRRRSTGDRRRRGRRRRPRALRAGGLDAARRRGRPPGTVALVGAGGGAAPRGAARRCRRDARRRVTVARRTLRGAHLWPPRGERRAP